MYNLGYRVRVCDMASGRPTFMRGMPQADPFMRGMPMMPEQRRLLPLKEEEDEMGPPTAPLHAKVAMAVVQALVMLAVFVFAVIALAISRTDAISRTCGTDLWNVYLAQVLLGVGIAIASSLLSLPAAAVCGRAGVLVSLLLIQVAAYSTMIGLLVTYITRANAAEGCIDALSDNFTHAPLLVIMGWIAMAGDTVFLFFAVCASISSAGIGMAVAMQEERDGEDDGLDARERERV